MAGEVSAHVRPWIRRLAIWVGPVLLLIGAWQIWDAVEAWRVQRGLAQIGPAPLPSPGAPPGADDAARYYAAAAIAAIDRNAESSIQLEPGGPIVSVLATLRQRLTDGAVIPNQLVVAAAQRGRSDVVLDLIARGAAHDYYRVEPGTDFTLQTSGLVEAHRAAALRTLQLVMERDGNGAAQLIVDRVRFLRALSSGWISDPWRFSLSREIAADVALVLQRSLSYARLGELEQALVEAIQGDDLADSIRREMYRRRDLTRSLWSGARRSLAGLVMRPLINHQFANALQDAGSGIAAARLQWPDRIDALATVLDRRFVGPRALQFFGFWFPRELVLRMAESIAAVRSARLAVKVERFRREKGILPAALTELTAPADEESIRDPFVGQPLRYLRDEAGYAIYSVGKDRRDDGGTFPAEPAMFRQPGGTTGPSDVGVRVRIAPQRAGA